MAPANHILQNIYPEMTGIRSRSAGVLQRVVAVMEMVAGILGFVSAQNGAYLVSTWLVLIALNLPAGGFTLTLQYTTWRGQ